MNTSDSSTLKNFQLYTMTVAGSSPVSLAEVKSYLGIPAGNTSNDVFLQTLIDSCTQWGQLYTGREFTANTYTLDLDCFEDIIFIRRNPVESISTVVYVQEGGATPTVDADNYYLKHGVQYAEILLMPDGEWPSDVEQIEQAIKITFVTKAIGVDKIAIAKNAILKHVSFMFENRGDCDDCGSCAGKSSSGAMAVYDLIRIPRV